MKNILNLQNGLYLHDSNEMVSHSSLRSGKHIGYGEAALPFIWLAPYTSGDYKSAHRIATTFLRHLCPHKAVHTPNFSGGSRA